MKDVKNVKIRLQEKYANIYSHMRFRKDVRIKFFIEKVVGHWHRFPRGMVKAPSPSEFKKTLDSILRNVV